MVNQEIVEGLRVALSRGYTLEQAMMSFWNAGYKKEDIEEAARVLQAHPSQTLSHPAKPIPEEMKKPIDAKPATKPSLAPKATTPSKQVISQYIPKELQEPKPKLVEGKPALAKPAEKKPKLEKPVDQTKKEASKYEEKTKPKGALISVLLIISLILLISILVGVFLFKDILVDFFSNLF